MIGERLAGQVSSAIAHPAAIVALPMLCLAWPWSYDTLSITLSVAALSLTQLVLLAQGRELRATRAQTAEIIRSLPEADDAMADADSIADTV